MHAKPREGATRDGAMYLQVPGLSPPLSLCTSANASPYLTFYLVGRLPVPLATISVARAVSM